MPRRPVAVSADRGQHLVAQQARQPLALRGLQSRCARLHGLSVGIFGTAFAAEASITETERCGMWRAERSVLRRGVAGPSMPSFTSIGPHAGPLESSPPACNFPVGPNLVHRECSACSASD